MLEQGLLKKNLELYGDFLATHPSQQVCLLPSAVLCSTAVSYIVFLGILSEILELWTGPGAAEGPNSSCLRQ